jgi:hypothetical protein
MEVEKGCSVLSTRLGRFYPLHVLEPMFQRLPRSNVISMAVRLTGANKHSYSLELRCRAPVTVGPLFTYEAVSGCHCHIAYCSTLLGYHRERGDSSRSLNLVSFSQHLGTTRFPKGKIGLLSSLGGWLYTFGRQMRQRHIISFIVRKHTGSSFTGS